MNLKQLKQIKDSAIESQYIYFDFYCKSNAVYNDSKRHLIKDTDYFKFKKGITYNYDELLYHIKEIKSICDKRNFKLNVTSTQKNTLGISVAFNDDYNETIYECFFEIITDAKGIAQNLKNNI